MTTRFRVLVACGLLSAVPAIADISITTIAYPRIPLPGFPGLYVVDASDTVPTGINDNGVIAGQFQDNGNRGYNPPFGAYGFIDSNGLYSDFLVGTPNCCSGRTFPNAINDSGTIVGNYLPDLEFGDLLGFVTSQSDLEFGFSSLFDYPGLFPGIGSTFFAGINDSGQVIGSYHSDLGGPSGGFLFVNDTFIPLPFTPLAINNLGQILGQYSNGDVIVEKDGFTLQNLGQLPFTPTGFNDAGVIVGGGDAYYLGNTAQINIPGATGVQINAINDPGTMVGTYVGADGQTYGFEESGYVPVTTPEPRLFGLLFVGLFCFVVQRRRTRSLDAPSTASAG